ncbi:MAG: hypothetical protein ACK533_07350, partial [Planctomycetota bacterium]
PAPAPGASRASAPAARGLPVHELRIELPTLEEWFHGITEAGDQAAESASTAASAGAVAGEAVQP